MHLKVLIGIFSVKFRQPVMPKLLAEASASQASQLQHLCTHLASSQEIQETWFGASAQPKQAKHLLVEEFYGDSPFLVQVWLQIWLACWGWPGMATPAVALLPPPDDPSRVALLYQPAVPTMNYTTNSE